MKEKLLIIGASGHGKVLADIATKMKKWQRIAFLDDDESIKLSMGIKVIGKTADVANFIDNWDIVIGIGNNYVRRKFQEDLEAAGASIPTLVHPNAIIGKQVELGTGTVVMAGVVINCDTRIGKGCIINTGATIDHDNSIEEYVHISPGVNLAGTVNIGQCTWIGIGSSVINNINITSACIVGAGAIVVRDILESGTYVGIPAHKL